MYIVLFLKITINFYKRHGLLVLRGRLCSSTVFGVVLVAHPISFCGVFSALFVLVLCTKH